MSTQAKEVVTEAQIQESINTDLEVAADEAFGTDVQIAEQAAAEAPAPEPVKSEEELAAEKKAADEAAQAEADKGKSEEELAAEKKAADDAAAEANKGKSEEELAAEKKAADDAADPYEVPTDMKGRTRERFEKLTGDLKESHQLVEKQTQVIADFRGVLEKTGMNPKELQQTLDLGALLKTNPEQAYEALTGVVSDLATQLGKVAPGVDPLEGFTDLKQRVDDKELSPEDAKELAAYRIREEAAKKQREAKAAAQTEQYTVQQQEEKQQQEFKTQVETAQGDVGTFLKESQADPDYEKIAPRLVNAAKFAAENLAPNKWLGYIKGEYEKVKEIASEVAPPNGGTPILDGGAPSGGAKEPSNLEELADQLL